METPLLSSISISMRSPKDINGVLGLPSLMISRQRTSARQQEPSLLPTLDTVPEPITVPAMSERVLAQCEISVGKSKVMSLPALGEPINVPLRVALSGKCNLTPSHASPSSSRVTRTGVKLVHGFD